MIREAISLGVPIYNRCLCQYDLLSGILVALVLCGARNSQRSFDDAARVLLVRLMDAVAILAGVPR